MNWKRIIADARIIAERAKERQYIDQRMRGYVSGQDTDLIKLAWLVIDMAGELAARDAAKPESK